MSLNRSVSPSKTPALTVSRVMIAMTPMMMPRHDRNVLTLFSR